MNRFVVCGLESWKNSDTEHVTYSIASNFEHCSCTFSLAIVLRLDESIAIRYPMQISQRLKCDDLCNGDGIILYWRSVERLDNDKQINTHT